MNEILAIAIPGGIAVGGALAILAAIALFLLAPRPLGFAFLACLLVFASSSSYGLEDATASNVFWVKGSRTFFYTFVEMGIVGAWIAMFYRLAWEGRRDGGTPLAKYYIALAVLLIGHTLFRMFEPRHSTLIDLSQRGFTNVVLQGMFIALVMSFVRTERDLRLFLLMMLALLGGRHVFGVVRWALFGGDPQNAYAVLGGSSVKITFWDINDLVLAAVMFAVCLWLLLVQPPKTAWKRAALALGALMALAVGLLSARRTGQIGILLTICLLAWLLPRGRRWPAVAAVAIAIPLVLVALGQRAGVRVPVLSSVLIDVKTDPWSDSRRSRFYELQSAWNSVKEEPVFGLGPSGAFKPTSAVGLEYHQGRYDFVHSGFGHMLLKGGIVGLVLFAGLLLAWLRHVRRHWSSLTGIGKAVAVGAVGGMAASLPNMLVGTPIPEIRTMLVMGLLMALPFVAIKLRAPRSTPLLVASGVRDDMLPPPAGRPAWRVHA